MGIKRKKRRRGRAIFRGVFWTLVILGAAWVITSVLSGSHLSIGNLPSSIGNLSSKVQNDLNSLSWVSQEFLPVNQYSRPGDKLTRVNAIVIHYVGNPGTTAEQNRHYFANLATSGETYASSHFLIGIDGEIIQCVPVNEIAYCSNSRNSDTLSVECCHPDASGKFSDATYASLVKLVAWLCNEYGLSSNDVIRHYDITGKICPKYFVDHPDAWVQFRSDVADAIKTQKSAAGK